MKFFLFFFISILLAILLGTNPAWAHESVRELGVINQKLALLEAKVKRISALQEQITQKQAAITEELDSLRIWIRRNRG